MKPYSTRPEAVASRHRRLIDDAFAKREAESSRRYRGRKRTEKLRRKAAEVGVMRDGGTRLAKAFLQRVARHLDRGRDAGDIAVRERVTVSRAQAAIRELKRTLDTTSQQSKVGAATGNRGRV